MDEARPGRTLAGRYRLIGKLGGGGAASVWRAEDLQTQAVVALKLLHPKYRAHLTVRDRLAREADLLSRFDHPNVARALGFGFEHVQPYFVMELIEGCSIQDELAERSLANRHFEPEELARIIQQLASAVEYAHAQGVVHRDLKPANIMLQEGPDGPTVKVLDFGIAKLLENTDPQIATTRGRVLGSGFYMAPEQALGQPVTARCDIFALASVMLELLTLRRAWVRDGEGGFVIAFGEPVRMNAYNQASELLRRLAQQPRPKASLMRPELGQGFDEVFEQGLAIDPQARPSSARSLAEDLMDCLPHSWGGDDTLPTPMAAALGSRAAMVEEVSLIGVPTTQDLDRDAGPTQTGRSDTEARPEPTAVDATQPNPAVDWLRSDAKVEPQPLDRNQSPSVVVTTAEQRTTIDPPSAVPQIVSPVAEPLPEDSWSHTPTGGYVPAPPAEKRGSAGLRILLTVAAVLSLLVVGFFAGRVTGPTSAVPVPEVALEPATPVVQASPRPAVVPSAQVPPPEPATEPAPEPARAPPAAATRARPATPAAAAPAEPAAPKISAELVALQARLRKLRAEPTDLEGVAALSAAIQKQARGVSDPDARRRIRRIAGSSSMVGDLDGVARALALLESNL